MLLFNTTTKAPMTIMTQFRNAMILSLVLGCVLILSVFLIFGNPSDNVLKYTNVTMAVIHLMVAVVMYVYSRDNTQGWDIFYESEVIEEGDVPGDTDAEKIENIRKRIFDKKKKKTTISSLFKLCALFSFLTFIAHSGLVLNSKMYLAQLRTGQNPTRWLEYFITSGIMMTCIASVSDVKTEYAILATFAFTALTNLFGMAIESSSSLGYKVFYMAAGFIPYVIPWYMIVKNYSLYSATLNDFQTVVDEATNQEVTLSNGEVITKADVEERLESLDMLKYIVFGIGILYNLFPAIQILQIVFPNKYRLGEMCFILASLVSKVSLNTGVFFLGNRPSTTAEYTETTE